MASATMAYAFFLAERLTGQQAICRIVALGIGIHGNSVHLLN